MKVGVLSGIHEDIVRLREALAVLRDRGCSAAICLGDITGFSATYYRFEATRDAHTCVQLVRQNCQYAVIGNHDLFAIKKTPRHSEFEYPPRWYERDYDERKRVSHGAIWLYEEDLPTNLTSEDADYLANLPEWLVVEFPGARVLLSHYASPNLVGDGIEFDPAKDKAINRHLQFMQAHDCDLGLFDHDLVDGVRIFAAERIEQLRFGQYGLPAGPAVLNGPWVANGTSPNGVLVVDFKQRAFEAIPLNTPVHVLP